MLLSLEEHRKERTWRVPIIKTSAASGEGVSELADKLAAHLKSLRATGALATRSGTQARSEMLALLHQALLQRIGATISAEEWNGLIEEVVDRRTDPYTAADIIARRIGLLSSATPES
jgi:LAO/AO transport system kinase